MRSRRGAPCPGLGKLERSASGCLPLCLTASRAARVQRRRRRAGSRGGGRGCRRGHSLVATPGLDVEAFAALQSTSRRETQAQQRDPASGWRRKGRRCALRARGAVHKGRLPRVAWAAARRARTHGRQVKALMRFPYFLILLQLVLPPRRPLPRVSSWCVWCSLYSVLRLTPSSPPHPTTTPHPTQAPLHWPRQQL